MKRKKKGVMIIAANNVWMLPKQRKRNQKNEKNKRAVPLFKYTHEK